MLFVSASVDERVCGPQQPVTHTHTRAYDKVGRRLYRFFFVFLFTVAYV